MTMFIYVGPSPSASTAALTALDLPLDSDIMTSASRSPLGRRNLIMIRSCFACSFLAVLSLAGTLSAAEIRGVVVRVETDRLVLEGRGAGARGVTWAIDLDKECEVLF